MTETKIHALTQCSRSVCPSNAQIHYHRNMDQAIVFGYQEQWQAFQSRNLKFLSRFESLKTAFNVAFLRSFSTSGPEERTIYMLGRLCCEDFFEILLLAGNGYGIGAQKLLRALYERAVTMAFLADNPSEVDAFLDYHAIAQHKLSTAIRKTMGPNILRKEQAETESEYLRVKDSYLITDCAKCGTKRLNHTWHKLDLVTMAHRTIFGDNIVAGYYLPMGHAHSTVRALISRLEDTDSEGLGFNPDPQPEEADRALLVSHQIMLGVLETQQKYFNLAELEQPLQKCMQDFMEIWQRNNSTPPTPRTVLQRVHPTIKSSSGPCGS
jgi:hypothetical protein